VTNSYRNRLNRAKKTKRNPNAMRITCVSCKKVFESLVIDKVMAWNECYTNLMQHAVKRHPEVMAQLQVDLQKVMVSVSAYVSVSRLADVPEDEAYINLLLDEFQKEIMLAAGFDEVEESDDEEEEETEDEGELEDGEETESETVATPLEVITSDSVIEIDK
jgi:hypothetical protein